MQAFKQQGRKAGTLPSALGGQRLNRIDPRDCSDGIASHVHAQWQVQEEH